MKNYILALKPKGSQPFKTEVVKAETQEEANKKGEAFIKNFETKDKDLEAFIKKCGGLDVTVTEIK